MSETSQALVKNPTLTPVLDFARLRRDGIGFIEQLGSRWWTDYNVHDPGITILEALCYAITDLGYRLDGRIEDILAPSTPSSDPRQPYPDQAFFTARQILTVNPVTLDDFRRLLIDLDKVRNAWMIGRECACEASYWAWCEDDLLVLSHARPPDTSLAPVKVAARGLYEALLELEPDPESGDLNDRKIESRTVFHDSTGAHTTILELRFPDLAASHRVAWTRFLDSDAEFADPARFDLKLGKFGATPAFNLFTELATDADRDNYVRAHWKTIFYVSFEIEVIATGEKLLIDNATLRLIGDASAKNATTIAALQAMLLEKSAAGFIRRYRQKGMKVREALASAKRALHSHRNLAEDFCRTSTVGIEEVAVCADVEVKAGADVERVQAEIWFAIEQYLNPSIRFRTLRERLDGDPPMEDVFDGPELASGFLDAAELEESTLQSFLRTSDILNRLMDIDGVIAVNQLLLTKYDSEGNVVRGAADPKWIDGVPIFDANRVSATWLLFISQRHLARLYLNQSRFLFLKNGLPFQARADEAVDALHQLRGSSERPRNQSAACDLPVPQGLYRDLEDYFPVQYSLPQAYAVGPEGLPPTAPARRQAQARQLKGYLAVFEQLIANSLAQLAHAASLFSLDPTVAHTYFVRRFDDATIRGFDAIARPNMTEPVLQALVETPSEFQDRRNRFLDHLLARFGEDFGEYALLLTDVTGAKEAVRRLIESKTAFLKRYPEVSHDRGRAFDYTQPARVQGNYPGVKKRITLLLGTPDLTFSWNVGTPAGDQYPVSYELTDLNGAVWFFGDLTETAPSASAAEQAAYRTLLHRMSNVDAYEVAEDSGQFRLKLPGHGAVSLGQVPRSMSSASEAVAMRDALLQWSSNERLIVVEHLLLRPKFPGDALYPACSANGCATCGDEDPYSFRLTFVMPGWLAQYADNLDLRGFATCTIQQEIPSHLLAKVCWVGNDGFTMNPCDEVVGKLADLLAEKGRTAIRVAPTNPEACACANDIYHAFSAAFVAWYEDKLANFIHPDAMAAQLTVAFQSIATDKLGCAVVLAAPLWGEVTTLMIEHFVDLVIRGWQFERFERAWYQWLSANAAIDWSDERLVARVQGMLQARLLTSPAKESELCACAESIVSVYGSAFFHWMRDNVVAGHAFEALTPFVPPAVSLCSGMAFQPGTAQAIDAFLGERYAVYREASYRLWVVVTLLGKLRNTYPGTTLHDCDDGSDLNPVRLDNTALGNYPLRKNHT